MIWPPAAIQFSESSFPVFFLEILAFPRGNRFDGLIPSESLRMAAPAPASSKSKSLESWIWDAACSIRGAKDAPNGAERNRLTGSSVRRVRPVGRIKCKDYILPLIFTEGLSRDGGKPQKPTEIGPIPESWELMPLGSLAKVGNGSTPKRDTKAYRSGGAIPWLNSARIHDRFITEPDQFVTDLAAKECHLPRVNPNSLLIAITGQGKTLGNSALTRFETCINQHLAYAQFHALNIVPDFVLWFMQTRYDYLRSIAQGGGRTKGALTCGFLKTLPIPVPPRAEQEEIATTFQILENKQASAVRKQATLQDLFRTLLHELMTAKTRVHELELSA